MADKSNVTYVTAPGGYNRVKYTLIWKENNRFSMVPMAMPPAKFTSREEALAYYHSTKCNFLMHQLTGSLFTNCIERYVHADHRKYFQSCFKLAKATDDGLWLVWDMCVRNACEQYKPSNKESPFDVAMEGFEASWDAAEFDPVKFWKKWAEKFETVIQQDPNPKHFRKLVETVVRLFKIGDWIKYEIPATRVVLDKKQNIAPEANVVQLTRDLVDLLVKNAQTVKDKKNFICGIPSAKAAPPAPKQATPSATGCQFCGDAHKLDSCKVLQFFEDSNLLTRKGQQIFSSSGGEYKFTKTPWLYCPKFQTSMSTMALSSAKSFTSDMLNTLPKEEKVKSSPKKKQEKKSSPSPTPTPAPATQSKPKKTAASKTPMALDQKVKDFLPD